MLGVFIAFLEFVRLLIWQVSLSTLFQILLIVFKEPEKCASDLVGLGYQDECVIATGASSGVE